MRRARCWPRSTPATPGRSTPNGCRTAPTCGRSGCTANPPPSNRPPRTRGAATMCNYCGCRDFPLIAQLTAEHEAIANAAGHLRRAITTGEGDPMAALDDLLALLMPHTGTEESGLFVELRTEGSLADAVAKLC